LDCEGVYNAVGCDLFIDKQWQRELESSDKDC
jgi:hypothetical protein